MRNDASFLLINLAAPVSHRQLSARRLGRRPQRRSAGSQLGTFDRATSTRLERSQCPRPSPPRRGSRLRLSSTTRTRHFSLDSWQSAPNISSSIPARRRRRARRANRTNPVVVRIATPATSAEARFFATRKLSLHRRRLRRPSAPTVASEPRCQGGMGRCVGTTARYRCVPTIRARQACNERAAFATSRTMPMPVRAHPGYWSFLVGRVLAPVSRDDRISWAHYAAIEHFEQERSVAVRRRAREREREREALRDPYRHRCWQNVRVQEYLDGILQDVMHGQVIRFVLNLNLRSRDPAHFPPLSPPASRVHARVAGRARECETSAQVNSRRRRQRAIVAQ